MATNSGIVLDYFTNMPISNVVVVSETLISGLYSQTTSYPDGRFSLNCPTSGYITYMPIKNGYIGYSTTLPYNESNFSLYMRTEPNIFSLSGTGYLNLNMATLFTGQTVTDIKSSPSHIYITTLGGLDILDINTYDNVGYVLYDSGFTCLSLNKDYTNKSSVLLGTSNSGVLDFPIPLTYSGTINLTSLLKNKWNSDAGNLTSNKVTCIDQTTSGTYLVGTNSGVDYFYRNTRYSHNYGLNLDTKCCKISKFNDLYYSPTNSGLYVKYEPNDNWIEPDYKVLISGTGVYPFPSLTNYINDVDIKSILGSNSVFIATNSGLLYYDENRLDLNISASGTKIINKYPI